MLTTYSHASALLQQKQWIKALTLIMLTRGFGMDTNKEDIYEGISYRDLEVNQPMRSSSCLPLNKVKISEFISACETKSNFSSELIWTLCLSLSDSETEIWEDHKNSLNLLNGKSNWNRWKFGSGERGNIVDLKNNRSFPEPGRQRLFAHLE